MIIASAVQFYKNDILIATITGKRHCNCFEEAYNQGIRRPWKDIQGFITDKQVFLNRYEAMEYAVEHKQVERNKCEYAELYSEDLW